MKLFSKIPSLISTFCLGMVATTFAGGDFGRDIIIDGNYEWLATYDERNRVLNVQGDDRDNIIVVSYDQYGRLHVNETPIKFPDLQLTADNTVGVMIHGGPGNDVLVADQLKDAAINGGEGTDTMVFNNVKPMGWDNVKHISITETTTASMGWDNVKNKEWSTEDGGGMEWDNVKNISITETTTTSMGWDNVKNKEWSTEDGGGMEWDNVKNIRWVEVDGVENIDPIYGRLDSGWVVGGTDHDGVILYGEPQGDILHLDDVIIGFQ